MRASPTVLVVFALVLLLGGCTMIDLRMAPGGGVHSDAFVSGYVDAGWPQSESLLKLGLVNGPSRGALLYLQLWKLLRVELGFLGLSLGVGPLDGGVGVLFYDPQPPTYVDGAHGGHEGHGGHGAHGDECDDCEECGADEEEAEVHAEAAADTSSPFIYTNF